jgi:hypothetical protein
LPNAETARETSKAAFPPSGPIRSKPPAVPSQTAKKHVLKSTDTVPNKTRRPVHTAFVVMLVGSVLTSMLFFYFQYKGGPKNTSTQQTSPLQKPGQSRAINFTQAKASSVMRLAPETMYTNYIKQYTVSPDRAIIGAFNDLIELYAALKGVPKDNITYRKGPVQYNEHEVKLTLLKADQIISEIRIPRPLDLEVVIKSMQDWLEVMDVENAFETIKPVRDDNWKEKVGLALADFHSLDPRLVINGLLRLEKLWQEEGADPRILLTAVRGYAVLLFGLRPDPMDCTDDFASRALAMLALAKRLDPALPVAREEAFLSMLLGYTAHAIKLINSGDVEIFGPVDHAFSAFIRQDLDGLKQHLRADAQLLELYLLARLYRQMGMYKEAENVTVHLLERFPHLYPAIVEIIYSANLRAAKYLTTIYPLDILARLEGQVKPSAIGDIATWYERVKVFTGRSAKGNVSFSQFEDLLLRWEPLKGIDHEGLLIDEALIKQVFRTLYTGAVSLRFNVLMDRWGVLDLATKYVSAFAAADPEHPLVMSMQTEV